VTVDLVRLQQLAKKAAGINASVEPGDTRFENVVVDPDTILQLVRELEAARKVVEAAKELVGHPVFDWGSPRVVILNESIAAYDEATR
jgi:hypothetical protein